MTKKIWSAQTRRNALPMTPDTTNTVGMQTIIVSVASLSIAGIAGVVTLAIFAGAQAAITGGVILGFIGTMSAALLALAKIDKVDVSVNSRMTDFENALKTIARMEVSMAQKEGVAYGVSQRAEGVEEGRAVLRPKVEEIKEDTEQIKADVQVVKEKLEGGE